MEIGHFQLISGVSSGNQAIFSENQAFSGEFRHFQLKSGISSGNDDFSIEIKNFQGKLGIFD